jgi:carbonic anhydrase/acetyltransferase-like protein (isoleucine patch superfamily)
MALYQLGDKKPKIHPDAWVADEAVIIGDVTIGARASVWPGAVVRGDNEPIVIGEGSNVQEGVVLHSDPGFPLTIGKNVSIGHQAMVHGCTVADGVLIGIQAVVLNGAKIGEGCLVGAGAVVTEGKEFAPGTMILGAPGKVVKELGPEQSGRLTYIAKNYAERQAYYKVHLKRID